MILARWFYRAVCSVWLLVAWAVGSTVRRFGRNARALEADHQRDGVGLLFLGLAIVFAASIWARMDNLAGQGIYTAASAVVGEGAFAIPILFALVGWRFFRHPDRNSALPPAEIGWTALLVGGLGLFSIARGVPTLAHHDGGWPAVKTAGGLIGMVAAWPLATGLTRWVATPLLALIGGYGLLVITGTPVRHVPDRLAGLAELFGYQRPLEDDFEDDYYDEDEDEDEELDRGSRRRDIGRGPIKLKGVIEAGDHLKPYDTPVVGRRRAALPRAAPGSCRRPGSAAWTCSLSSASATERTARTGPTGEPSCCPTEPTPRPPTPRRPRWPPPRRAPPPPGRCRRARCWRASSSS